MNQMIDGGLAMNIFLTTNNKVLQLMSMFPMKLLVTMLDNMVRMVLMISMTMQMLYRRRWILRAPWTTRRRRADVGGRTVATSTMRTMGLPRPRLTDPRTERAIETMPWRMRPQPTLLNRGADWETHRVVSFEMRAKRWT